MDRKNEEQTFIFVVSAGRSGQSSFSRFLEQAYPKSFVAFEEPQIRYVFPKFLNWPERKFRRAFIETDELLGRGKVLSAFAQNDEALLEQYGLQKFNWLKSQMATRGCYICFDVNKHFLHGLHIGMQSLVRPNYQLVHLIRDPLLNMRSFLNRNKNFYLDNGVPNCEFNEIRLDPSMLTKGQLYLHAWCECYLRANKFATKTGIKKHTLLTQDLTDTKAMNGFLAELGLPYKTVKFQKKTNTNLEQGFGRTTVTDQDIVDALNFMNMLSSQALAELPLLTYYMKKYGA